MQIYEWQGPTSLDIVVPRAQKAIDNYKSKIGGTKIWFQQLLEILKKEKYARIQLYTKPAFTYDEADHKEDFVDFVDVSKIADTHDYASFFDIFNHEYMINFDFVPVEINKLEYSLRDFYYKYYKIHG
jgi:hypothetical protein